MKRIILPMLFLVSLISCENDAKSSSETTSVVLANQSVTQCYWKQAGFESLELFSLIASDDVLAGSPNFVFEVLQMDQDYWEMLMVLTLVNHEDNFAVSRVTFDKTFKPTGEYLLNSNGGTEVMWCYNGYSCWKWFWTIVFDLWRIWWRISYPW
jgi:hypothetical protein